MFVNENGAVTYEGRTMKVFQKSSGKYIMDVDGRKIKVTSEQFVLMFIYFSILYKGNSRKMEQNTTLNRIRDPLVEKAS